MLRRGASSRPRVLISWASRSFRRLSSWANSWGERAWSVGGNAKVNVRAKKMTNETADEETGATTTDVADEASDA